MREPFSEYRYRVLRATPKFTYPDLCDHFKRSGVAISKFLNGDIDKWEFVSGGREDSKSSFWPDRVFFINTAQELCDILSEYSEDTAYAQDQMYHEMEHARQFSEFMSSDGQYIDGTIYSVRITSDRYITPFACPYILDGSQTPIQCVMSDVMGDVLTEDSLKEYFWYLRDCVADPSEGDKMILSI